MRVLMLQVLYRKHDLLTSKYNIFKVKSITFLKLQCNGKYTAHTHTYNLMYSRSLEHTLMYPQDTENR